MLADAARNAASGGWPQLQMQTALIQGALLVLQARYPEAQAVSTELVERAQQAGDAYYLAGARINLSMVAIRQGRLDEAIALSYEALADAQRAGAQRFAAVAAINIAAFSSHVGDFDRAKRAHEVAVKTLEVTGDRRTLQSHLGVLATTLLREGDPAAAVPLYERAFHTAQQIKEPGSAQLWAANLAYALVLKQDWKQAREWNTVARQLSESTKRDPARLAYLELNDHIITFETRDYKAARKHLDQIREPAKKDIVLGLLTEASYAMLARATGDIGGSNRRYDEALRMVERVSDQIRQSQVRITYRSRLMRTYQEYVQSLLAQGRVDRALEVAESSRAQLLAERLGRKVSGTRGTAREMIAKAKACGCTLLSYWLAPRESAVWVVRASGIRYEKLAPVEAITRLAAAHRKEILDGLGDPLTSGAGRELSQALLAPVEKYLPAGSRVIVVPDGAINSINLEALPVGKDTKHFWIEDATIALAPSLLVLEAGRLKPAQSALLVGAPSFASADFPKLPHAAEELHAIRGRLSNVPTVVYEGAAATPEAYRKEAPRLHSYIHFAAHADVRQENPFDSAVILSGQGGTERLYGRDIATQPMEAELVTVSACKSAGARTFAGEGLTGLAWAFLQSGARRVVAGSWDVSDRSSTRLMDRLYENLNAGGDPVDSLRDAKLTLLRAGGAMQHPFYWAALQMYVRVMPGRK